MTDEQIVKALECCSSRKNCEENCPYFELKRNFFECVQVSTSDAINCIRRQQAEIDRMKTENERVKTNIYKMAIDKALAEKAKAEAIKEFAEKVKEKAKENPFWYIHVEDIDNLVKEMVGADNG